MSVVTESVEAVDAWQPKRAGIPNRLIHIFCPKQGQTDGMPLLCRASRASAEKLNPDFRCELFGRKEMNEFVRTEFPEYEEVFHSFARPIQQFDFFRYLAVYRLGGIYLDLDIFLARGLKPLTKFSCVFPFEELTVNTYLRRRLGIDWELGNYAFGAEAGHPFIKAVIENCVRAQRDPGWGMELLRDIPAPFREQFYVTNTTGPGMVTRTFAENKELQSSVTILCPEDVCDESGWHQVGDYGVHLMNAAWRKRESFIRARLARYWENNLRKRYHAESQRLGPTRPGPWQTEVYRGQ
jgi:hypothetical protein